MNVSVKTKYFFPLAVGLTAMLGAAYAGEEQKCAEQYSFDEQQVLEWAALGGDPHAQFALAQCALPKNAKGLTADEKSYAFKWVTIAACDSADGEHTAARDEITRRLKEEGDLSYRRFGGTTGEEDWSRREKRFLRYRARKSDELMQRQKRLSKLVDDAEMVRARAALGAEFSRMGPVGKLRLAQLSSCGHFGASQAFEAASWSVAAEAWSADPNTGVYDYASDDNLAIEAEASKQVSKLADDQRPAFAFEKANLGRYDDARIDAMEADAALSQLGELRTLQSVFSNQLSANQSIATAIGASSIPVATFDAVGAGRSSVTMAAQYALEALGFMEFINGPDNDYGPSTIEAVAAAQADAGRPRTRWLSHKEARDMICAAATEANDPVSYYNLAEMHLRGVGFPVQLVKAQYAADRAEALLEEKLRGKDDLPEWKTKAYPQLRNDISATKKEIARSWDALPAHAKNRMAEWSGEGQICR